MKLFRISFSLSKLPLPLLPPQSRDQGTGVRDYRP